MYKYAVERWPRGLSVAKKDVHHSSLRNTFVSARNMQWFRSLKSTILLVLEVFSPLCKENKFLWIFFLLLSIQSSLFPRRYTVCVQVSDLDTPPVGPNVLSLNISVDTSQSLEREAASLSPPPPPPPRSRPLLLHPPPTPPTHHSHYLHLRTHTLNSLGALWRN